MLTTAGTVTAAAGSGGVFITETNGANFTATATGAGPISLTSTTGVLGVTGATSTGSGPITLSSGDAVSLSANVGGAGSGPITITANTQRRGCGQLHDERGRVDHDHQCQQLARWRST